jgi:hypothetical protein
MVPIEASYGPYRTDSRIEAARFNALRLLLRLLGSPTRPCTPLHPRPLQGARRTRCAQLTGYDPMLPSMLQGTSPSSNAPTGDTAPWQSPFGAAVSNRMGAERPWPQRADRAMSNKRTGRLYSPDLSDYPSEHTRKAHTMIGLVYSAGRLLLAATFAAFAADSSSAQALMICGQQPFDGSPSSCGRHGRSAMDGSNWSKQISLLSEGQ